MFEYHPNRLVSRSEMRGSPPSVGLIREGTNSRYSAQVIPFTKTFRTSAFESVVISILTTPHFRGFPMGGPIYWGSMGSMHYYCRGIENLCSRPAFKLRPILSVAGQVVRASKLDRELCRLRSARKPLIIYGRNLMVIIVRIF